MLGSLMLTLKNLQVYLLNRLLQKSSTLKEDSIISFIRNSTLQRIDYIKGYELITKF